MSFLIPDPISSLSHVSRPLQLGERRKVGERDCQECSHQTRVRIATCTGATCTVLCPERDGQTLSFTRPTRVEPIGDEGRMGGRVFVSSRLFAEYCNQTDLLSTYPMYLNIGTLYPSGLAFVCKYVCRKKTYATAFYL